MSLWQISTTPTTTADIAAEWMTEALRISDVIGADASVTFVSALPGSSFLAKSPGYISTMPEVLAWCEQLTPRYGEMVDCCASWRSQPYAHTDVRADNFLFGGSAGATS